MTVKEFPLPDLGEGLTDGEILKWLVAEGDTIALNQPLVEVETAKAAVEIPAKWAGRVVRIFHPEGATVEVGTPLVSIDTEPDAGGTPQRPPAPATGAAAPEPGTDGGDGEPAAGLIGGAAPGGRTAVLVGYGPRTGAGTRRPRKATADSLTPAAAHTATPAATTPAAAPALAPTGRPSFGGTAASAEAGSPGSAKTATTMEPAGPGGAGPGSAEAGSAEAAGGPVLAKPPVRKLARDLGVDLAAVPGTGPAGSITRDDVLAAADGGAATVATDVASGPDGQVSGAAVFGPGRERRIPIKGVRKLTAANVAASAFTAPHVTEFLTVDMTRSMRALDRLRAMPQWRQTRVSPLLLVAKAVLLAARRHPVINSTWDEAAGEIVVKEYVNLGIAAATERGLIVPNIKDAGRLTLRELADALGGLVQTAKSGKTPPSEMSGGTLTITNVGVFGVDSGTPILPPGEAAILAFGAVREAPWVHKGKVRPRQVTTLALSFDHRIVDGELGSMFLREVGAFLTDPEAALLAWT
jgi:pyruvate dehydrogenase E2 component (dihydrolipoamide acetyltransferase)